jgi:hypothetical protein
VSVSDDFHGNRLPPFPVDDATLDLLWAALHPGPDAEKSSVWPLLDMFSRLGGSDPEAVEEQLDDNTALMRDQHYHDDDVVESLIIEVRRLRALIGGAS